LVTPDPNTFPFDQCLIKLEFRLTTLALSDHMPSN
jgi:hypothetical protein